MTEKQKCSARVSGEGRWGAFHQHPCRKSAKVERDGKWYCGTHDPIAKKSRDAKSQAIWQAKWDRDIKRDRLRSYAPQLLEALQKIADNYGGCHCDHSDESCCEHPAVGEFCPHCIAEIAIKSTKGETL